MGWVRYFSDPFHFSSPPHYPPTTTNQPRPPLHTKCRTLLEMAESLLLEDIFLPLTLFIAESPDAKCYKGTKSALRACSKGLKAAVDISIIKVALRNLASSECHAAGNVWPNVREVSFSATSISASRDMTEALEDRIFPRMTTLSVSLVSHQLSSNSLEPDCAYQNAPVALDSLTF